MRHQQTVSVPQKEENPSRSMDPVRPPVGTRVGLIAGSGSLPLLFAKALRSNDSLSGGDACAYPLFVVAHEDETDSTIGHYAQDVQWVRLGQFNRIIRYLTQKKVQWVVMAGGITKTRLWKVRPDALALSLLLRLNTLHDDRLLRAVATLLERRGFHVASVTDFVPELLIPVGTLSRKEPNAEQWEEIRFGWRAAKALGQLDIGQGVVVKRKMVISVEAIEGTDAMIARTGPLLSSGSGSRWANSGSSALVKTAKPQQDHRLDLPTIGPTTMENVYQAGIDIVAVEAGSTLLLNPEKTVALADDYGIILTGCSDSSLQESGC